MTSLQYLIDTICSRLTEESIYRMIGLQLNGGGFKKADLVRSIRNEDRSLDDDSAMMLTEAALRGLEERGSVTVDGDFVRPAT